MFVGGCACTSASERSSVRVFVDVRWDYITTGTIKSVE